MKKSMILTLSTLLLTAQASYANNSIITDDSDYSSNQSVYSTVSAEVVKESASLLDSLIAYDSSSIRTSPGKLTDSLYQYDSDSDSDEDVVKTKVAKQERSALFDEVKTSKSKGGFWGSVVKAANKFVSFFSRLFS